MTTEQVPRITTTPPRLGPRARPAGGRNPASAPAHEAEHELAVLSRHRTSEGIVTYARCACGELQIWLTGGGRPAHRLIKSIRSDTLSTTPAARKPMGFRDGPRARKSTKELGLTANPSLPAADDDASARLGASVAVSLPDHEIPTVSPLPLMQLSIGFWSFKALATAYELDLFTHLAGTGGRTVEELAETLGIAQRPAELLITACASVGLLQRRDGRYVNSALADEFLVRGKPYHFGGWVQMLDRRLYPAWGRLIEAVRANRPTSWNPDEQAHLFDGEDPLMLALFWEAMHSLSTITARELGDHVDLSASTALLDIGGGSGAYDIELCRRNPNLRATVFDLPPVCKIATETVGSAGFGDRIEVTPGDFLADAELPAGHDVVLLSMIMHDWPQSRTWRFSASALPHSLPAARS